MNQLSVEDRKRVVTALVEGNSIRATVRMTGIAKNTVTKLLVDLGMACKAYQDTAFMDLPCKRIQADEIWSFCYAKNKNMPDKYKNNPNYGDIWTWTAICADTKLVPVWTIGGRDLGTAIRFTSDLKRRFNHRIQLTTDGYPTYRDAVKIAFGKDIDFMMMKKLYGKRYEKEPNTRYSPPECIGVERVRISGTPDPKHVSTSYVERCNLSMRMGMRRYTRLTNGHSKKIENLNHAVSLHFAYYNLCRVHQSLGVTPAMAAGKADRVWSIDDLIGLLVKKQLQRGEISN